MKEIVCYLLARMGGVAKPTKEVQSFPPSALFCVAARAVSTIICLPRKPQTQAKNAQHTTTKNKQHTGRHKNPRQRRHKSRRRQTQPILWRPWKTPRFRRRRHIVRNGKTRQSTLWRLVKRPTQQNINRTQQERKHNTEKIELKSCWAAINNYL